MASDNEKRKPMLYSIEAKPGDVREYSFVCFDKEGLQGGELMVVKSMTGGTVKELGMSKPTEINDLLYALTFIKENGA